MTLTYFLLMLIWMFSALSIAASAVLGWYAYKLISLHRITNKLREQTERGRTLIRFDNLEPTKPTYWGGKR